jgi:hypothetical protein
MPTMKPATPGTILPGGIVLIDEPAHVNVTTFAQNGEVLLIDVQLQGWRQLQPSHHRLEPKSGYATD